MQPEGWGKNNWVYGCALMVFAVGMIIAFYIMWGGQ